jgi:hypothetical protein
MSQVTFINPKKRTRFLVRFFQKIHGHKKSASALNSPDKHKPHQTRRLLFAFLSGVAYDLGRKGFISSLEGLGVGAGQFL